MKNSFLAPVFYIALWGFTSFFLGACLEPGVKNKCRSNDDCLIYRVCFSGECIDEDAFSENNTDGGQSPICNDSCSSARDGFCDDGSSNSDTSFCTLGTDCADCNTLQSCEQNCSNDNQECNENFCMTKAERVFSAFICSEDEPCPEGQQCRYGYCAQECSSSGDCFASLCIESAPSFCAPRGDFSCSANNACEAGGRCVLGACVVATNTSTCSSDSDCNERSLCLGGTSAADDLKHCAEVPFCDDGQECDPGEVGSICNIRILLNKNPICLLGHCRQTEDCLRDAVCIQNPQAPTGRCTEKLLGSFCLDNTHCSSGTCSHEVNGSSFYGKCI